MGKYTEKGKLVELEELEKKYEVDPDSLLQRFSFKKKICTDSESALDFSRRHALDIQDEVNRENKMIFKVSKFLGDRPKKSILKDDDTHSDDVSRRVTISDSNDTFYYNQLPDSDAGD